jgi:phosphatidylinositol-3-phosphatase
MPTPNKVVILVLENHSYNQIVGSPYAPYINSLINDSLCARFTQSYALVHPSQPNYIQLFSGSTQGVTTNNIPPNLPFTTPNLGAALLAASRTFIAYSQSLPSVGYTGEVSGAYARKHAPWVNWQGNGLNGIPGTLHQPFTAFPSNYNNLPTVSFVIPDQNNDMHNGTDPSRITTSDTWIQNNLNGYVQWAKANNSLFILTFDEDDNLSANHIITFLIGPMVQKNNYSNHIDHYNVLRMVEDFYGLTHSGAASTAVPIDYCWKCPVQSETITANGPTTFCAPNTVTLSAPSGNIYRWSNGATTQNLVVDSSGNYFLTMMTTGGCWSTTNTISVTVNRLPTITSVAPAGGPVGSSVTINGSVLSGVSAVTLNGMAVNFTIVNDGKITFTVPAGASSGYIQVTNGCGTTQSANQFMVASTIPLNLKLLIEGFYKGGGLMQATLPSGKCDTVTVELAQSSSPYAISYSANAVVDTLGNSVADFPVSAYGTSWYIIVSSRNTLKTWSALPIQFINTIDYDFSNASSKAFGNNQKNLNNGYFGIYSGDVNHDNKINMSDFNILKNVLYFFVTGYSAYDLTGDGLVESTDFSLIENNCLPRETARP